ncbi:MAG: DUF2914 domain-containing protein [Fibrobacter sp.]|nr:DUF2914 domain-containing protein [Fibrobacter sp.]
MEFVDNLRAKPAVQKIEKFIPAVAFLGGFAWDSITLGMSINDSDLAFLVAYYIGALIFIVLLSARIVQVAEEPVEPQKKFIARNAIAARNKLLDREWSDVWKARFTWVLQFLFGGMFSALVVCYFKSSGSLASFILVLCLAALLVGNEFLQKRYESFALNLALFCLLGTMVLNFTIPYFVHGIGFRWFFLSTVVSLGICFLVWKIARRPKRMMVVPVLISILLTVAYLMNWVPPVPLVLKQQMVCQNFDKKNYSCDVDYPTIFQRLNLEAPTVHRVDGNEVYFLSSVFAPAKLKAGLEFRWYYQDPTTGKYKLTDKISSGRMVMNGGRESGFRIYSNKRNVPPGKYRVETAYKNGAVVGASAFEVLEGMPVKGFVRDSLR